MRSSSSVVLSAIVWLAWGLIPAKRTWQISELGAIAMRYVFFLSEPRIRVRV